MSYTRLSWKQWPRSKALHISFCLTTWRLVQFCSSEEFSDEGKTQPSCRFGWFVCWRLWNLCNVWCASQGLRLSFPANRKEVQERLCARLEFLSCLDFSVLCHFCYVGPWCVIPDAMTLFADMWGNKMEAGFQLSVLLNICTMVMSGQLKWDRALQWWQHSKNKVRSRPLPEEL